METTVGKLLLKKKLPLELQHYSNLRLEKKNINNLFQDLVDKKPQEYSALVNDLTRFGFEVSTRQGSSVSLEDLKSPIDKKIFFDKLDKEVDSVKNSKLSDKEKMKRLNAVYSQAATDMEKSLLDAGLEKNHTLAKVILSGSRGSPAQYRQTIGTPLIVNDAKGTPLTQFPLKNSFAEGLSLPEYLMHSFGARQGEVSKKLAVAQSGYVSKQLTRAGMTIKVEMHDCNTSNGISVPVDDKDSIGAFLAQPAGTFNRNQEITATMLNTLKEKGVNTIYVRSPITCQASKNSHSGAVCQLCTGKREKSKLPEVGEFVGVTAATTLGEPLSQSLLNVKHQSGSAGGTNVAGGFALINQLVNIPQAFQGKAILSEFDGVVKDVKKAPQGGYYVVVESR